MKDIEKQIFEMSQTKDKLQAELEQLNKQEKDILIRSELDLVEGRELSFTQNLFELRTRRDLLVGAITRIDANIHELRQQQHDLQLAAAASVWMNFEKGFWEKLRRIQDALGEAGLNGEVQKLQEELVEARRNYPATSAGGLPQLAVITNSGLISISRQLFQAWQAAEALQAYNPNRQLRGSSDKPNVVSGFGKLL